jgi:capsular exopolysaccharide synthesis family protein
LKAQLESLAERKVYLEGRYTGLLRELLDREGPVLDLELARGELERTQAIYDQIRDRRKSIETEMRAPEHIVPMQDAAPPRIPLERIPYKQILMAAAAALCLPFSLAVLWEYRVRRISDAQQLESQALLPVVGEVASFPVRRSGTRSLTHTSRGLRLFEESIDSLRTFLVLAQPMRDVQVLAITSATPREGKTCIASQLAVSIARCTGELTLLIDGDMRSPDIHDIFNVEPEPGLAQVLSREVSLEEAIDTSWSDRVHILPAGRLTANPHQLLGNGAWKALLSEARQRYKHVVIDTPPVLSAGESLMLASAADASLLCVMRNRSRVEQVTRSCQRLTEAGAKVVGSVLSGVPVKEYAKSYGDYAYVRT